MILLDLFSLFCNLILSLFYFRSFFYTSPRLRLERIKRNQERLRQLGLEGLSEDLKKQRSHKKKKKPLTAQQIMPRRELLSRKTKEKEVDYSGDLNLKVSEFNEKLPGAGGGGGGSSSNKTKTDRRFDQRVPLFIYQEFLRMRTKRKNNIKVAKRHRAHAQREMNFWKKQLGFIMNREKQKLQRDQLLKQQEIERTLLNGKTQLELLQEIDDRTPELLEILQEYDDAKLSVEEQERRQQLELEDFKKKQALDRKMKMVDAIDRFPKAMNEALSTLNALLYTRSPKDPPPPRRSKRSHTEEEEEELRRQQEEESTKGKKKKRAKTTSAASAANTDDIDDNVDATWSNLAASLAAADAAASSSKSQKDATPAQASAAGEDEGSTTTAGNKPRQRKKDARNIGGWVSPAFAQQLDRSWLERTKPLKQIAVVPPAAVPKGGAMTVFDLKSYVPQVGDVVLYYPSSHRDFLVDHFDTLGIQKMRNLLRLPLWQRGRREMARFHAGTLAEEEASKIWWTEDWINSLLDKNEKKKKKKNKGGNNNENDDSTPSSSSLGDYPIICRVERTHIEFPTDPYAKDKSVIKSNGNTATIAWDGAKNAAAGNKGVLSSSSKGKTKVERPQIRLAVLLKPLTTVLPENFGPGDRSSPNLPTPANLSIPPNFCVLTCPVSPPLDPFIVPFCWAYTSYHTLSIGEPVYIRQAVEDDYQVDESETKKAGRNFHANGKGRITAFPSGQPNKNGATGENASADDMNRFVDMADINPMMGGSAAWPQPEEEPPGTLSNPSFRLKDRKQQLDTILSAVTTDGRVMLDDLQEALSSEQSGVSLPLREAGIVVDFLAVALGRINTEKHPPAKKPPSDTSTSSLMSFIHSTLPPRHGISVTFDTNRRQTYKTSPWNVVKLQPSELSRSLQDGFLDTLESSLREKAIMCIQDIIKNNALTANLFLEIVTENVAPGYYCAVPVAMFFNRILARLNANSRGICYYSSIESILTDLTAIAENCMLYNSPDSDLVWNCNELINESKKFISDIGNQHAKGVVSGRDGVATISNKKRLTLSIPDSLNTPFKGQIDRDWIQRIYPDKINADRQTKNSTEWLPQCGDHILYSLTRHTQFINFHMGSLDERQCNVPKFEVEDEGLKEKIRSEWLQGTVVSVRASFPLPHTSKDAKESFMTVTPILTIELRLNYKWVNNTFLVSWRPCLLCSDEEEGCTVCKSCKLTSDSFLRPFPKEKERKIIETDVRQMKMPPQLSPEISKSMIRCFDLLKRRCLNGIPPAFVDPDEALENAERDVTISPGSRSLPTFEEFLSPANKKKHSSTRGIKKEDDTTALATLGESGYMPVWTSEFLTKTTAGTSKDKSTPRYETMMPFPTQCLELIRLRLASGFYRNVIAVVNDISESYVTSVLYLLSGPAFRKNDRISMRKITKYLASSKGNGKMSKMALGNKPSKKKSADGAEEGPETKKKKKDSAKEEDDSPERFTEEEQMLINRISQIRILHASAIVFSTETVHVERLFCLKAVVSNLPPPPVREIKPVDDSIEYTPEQQAAVNSIRYLMQALGKTTISIRSKNSQSQVYSIRVTCGGQVITEYGQKEKQEDGVTYYEPAYAVARLKDSSRVKVRIICDGESICGEKTPLVSSSTTGWSVTDSLGRIQKPPAPIRSDRVGRDQIDINWSLFDKNEDLARVLYGTPGRRLACVRCSTRGLGMVTCRVRRGHDCPDYAFLENFQGTDGVDSLLRPFKSTGGRKAEARSNIGIEDPKSMIDAIPEAVKDLEEEARKADATREKRAQQAKENSVKAEQYFHQAQYLLSQAQLLEEGELKLTDEFIAESFPFDPDDNHYVYCITCGLSGDLLVCESCPNVMHTKCAGLEKVPEGDWFCHKCSEKKNTTGTTGDKAVAKDDGDKKPAAKVDSLGKQTAKKKIDATEKDGAENPQENESEKTDSTSEKPPVERPDASSEKPQVDRKPAPLPEISEDEFDLKESELGVLISGLVTQHEAIDAKKAEKKKKAAEKEKELEKANQKKKGADKDNNKKKLGGKSSSSSKSGNEKAVQYEDPMDVLSSTAIDFLSSISIETADDFLNTRTGNMADQLIKWRKKKKMRALAGSGNTATISSWKNMVRNAMEGKTIFKPDNLDDDKDAEVIPKPKPRSRASIDKRVNAFLKKKRPQPDHGFSARAKLNSSKRAKSRSENPLDDLPLQGRKFCEYMGITDVDDFLSRTSYVLAEALVKFRKKEKMPVLAGSGPSAYIGAWKTQLRCDVAMMKAEAEEKATTKKSKKAAKEAAAATAAETDEQEQQTTTGKRKRGRPRKGSKVHDVIEEPEAKQLRTFRGKKTSRQQQQKQQEEQNGGGEGDGDFDALDVIQSLAEDEAKKEEVVAPVAPRVSSRGRRSMRTDRYQPTV